MPLEEIIVILDTGMKLTAFGYFTHGFFWRNTPMGRAR